jgi:hypothetical protein
MAEESSKFWGYRHIHILPYNSQANGIAEASVKRIKLLLDRHCKGHRNWHVLIPVLQLKLNTDVHSGIRTSPYVALFGREPVGLEQLEDPSLYPEMDDSDHFLRELPGRMRLAHETLRQLSDTLKQAHADEMNTRKHALASNTSGIVQASTADEAKYAWVIHGSKEQAAYVAKHGHGLPWKHKYKVLEVRPHSVRLEIPIDGSVPRVNEWQLRRRVARAPAGDHTASDNDPVITESGLAMPGEVLQPTDDPMGGDLYAGDEAEYTIETVKYAERVGSHYKLWIKWSGSPDLTWRWAHELRAETSNDELLQNIETVISIEREKLRATRKDNYAEQEETFEEPPPTAVVEQPAEQLGRGAPRVRNRPDRLVMSVTSPGARRVPDLPNRLIMFTTEVQIDQTIQSNSELLSRAYGGLLRRLSAACAYLPLYEYYQ